jgi:hypothetical protein
MIGTYTAMETVSHQARRVAQSEGNVYARTAKEASMIRTSFGCGIQTRRSTTTVMRIVQRHSM